MNTTLGLALGTGLRHLLMTPHAESILVARGSPAPPGTVFNFDGFDYDENLLRMVEALPVPGGMNRSEANDLAMAVLRFGAACSFRQEEIATP